MCVCVGEQPNMKSTEEILFSASHSCPVVITLARIMIIRY